MSVDEGTTYEGQYIALGSDIDLSAIENWNPIGAEGAPGSNKDKIFNGSFDGAGHVVSGLRITGLHEDWQNAGLFSTLNTAAVIHDLTVSGAAIDMTASGTTRVGGLAGDTIGNSAGIAARADAVAVTGSIALTAENDAMLFAGGLFGRTMAGAVVSNSWTDVSVTAYAAGAGYPSTYAGGIVGMGGNNAAVVNVAAFGSVYSATPQGDTLVGYGGGLAGMYPGRLWNAFSEGDVTYGRADSSQHSWGGALVGQMTQKASAEYLYYASDAALTLQAWSGDSSVDSALPGATGSSLANSSFQTIEPREVLSRAQMSDPAFADTMNGNLQAVYVLLKEAGLDGVVTLRNWTASDGKVVPAGDNWYTETPDAGIFASGSGTEEDPWIIETAEQMFAFAASLGEKMNYEGCTIALGGDIDLSANEWTPVGLCEYAFGGTFDGRGFTIRGMHRGTQEEAAALPQGEPYFALFGVLENTAVVRNIRLTDVMVNITYPASSYVGGIAGYLANEQSDSYAGAWIDNCHVSGKITTVQDKGNLFIGGIAAYQYKGAVTNCSASMELSGTVKGEALAEVGGLVALVNRGLIANSYAFCDVYGSGNRENDNEGMAVVSSLVAVDAGSVVGCYGSGSHVTKEFSNYAGMISGWVTGVGKAYSCWYDADSPMTVNGEKVDPPETIGTKVPGGVSEDGLVYVGGVVDDLQGYTAQTYAQIAEKLNEKFAAYPIDVETFGVPANGLFQWVFADDTVTFSSEKGTVSYVQPEAEQYVKPEAALRDGVWYGRDAQKKSVVQITVENAAVTKTEAVSGDETGDAFEEALAVAKEKATYGDFSHYQAPDPSIFAGGRGTQASPYLIGTAEQLRYLAKSINEDNGWDGVWFRQTADISIAGEDWIPIGWALEAEIDNQEKTFCAYPFKGNYDGGGYTIFGLSIGTPQAPADMMTLGLFGLTAGGYTTNETPTDETPRVVLRNIHLRDAAVYGKTKYQAYAGILAGSCQNGIEIDHCDAAGILSAETSDSHCRAGGLIASGLRGKMTNCWTDVSVTAVTDTGRTYGAGLVATSNRLTIVNAYTLGSVAGGSSSNNMTFLGGIDGMEGGVHINCYSSGNVESFKTTSGVGANNGLVGGISVNKASYYNSDASLLVAGKAAEMKASGANYAGATDEASGRSSTQITGEEFAAELNANIAGISSILEAVNAELAGGSHILYYTGDGSDLDRWAVIDGAVRFVPGAWDLSGIQTEYNVVYGAKAFTIAGTDGMALTFSSDKPSVASVNAGGRVTIKGAGTATITVTAEPNAQYASGSVKVTVNVAKAASTVTLKAKSAAYTGKTISIGKATVKGSTGKVTYKYYSDSACKKQVSKVVNAGTYYAKATVAADDNYKAAVGKAVKLVVKKAASTVTLKAKSAVYTGKAISTGKATVKGSKGKVTYKYYSDSACKKQVSKAVNAGTYYVKATVAADANYKAATSKAAKLVVNKAAQKVKTATSKLAFSLAKVKKASQTAQIRTTITGKGKVTYAKSSGSKSITVSKDGRVTVKKGLGKGTYKIKVTISIAAAANYKAASAVRTITITVK